MARPAVGRRDEKKSTKIHDPEGESLELGTVGLVMATNEVPFEIAGIKSLVGGGQGFGSRLDSWKDRISRV